MQFACEVRLNMITWRVRSRASRVGKYEASGQRCRFYVTTEHCRTFREFVQHVLLDSEYSAVVCVDSTMWILETRVSRSNSS